MTTQRLAVRLYSALLVIGLIMGLIGIWNGNAIATFIVCTGMLGLIAGLSQVVGRKNNRIRYKSD